MRSLFTSTRVNALTAWLGTPGGLLNAGGKALDDASEGRTTNTLGFGLQSNGLLGSTNGFGSSGTSLGFLNP